MAKNQQIAATICMRGLVFFLFSSLLVSCENDHPTPSASAIEDLHLKKGALISCGAPDEEFGTVDFEITGDSAIKKDFNIAVELLHSFEYDESEKVFARIIERAPGCAMAYWGVAMCNFHPLWEPPTKTDITKGGKAIDIAQAIHGKSQLESAFIDAAAAYYKDWDKNIDFHVRAGAFEKAMGQVYQKYPGDAEAAIFYALSLDAAASPTDRSYTNQRKAGEILNALYKTRPNHPGITHYIIHTYDYPGIADQGLAAARRYAEVAPSSAHALHMPSHIFTRLGLWDDCIRSNIASVAAARCYAQSAGIKGHWDEELHGLDYLIYACLQKGDNVTAGEQLKYLDSIREVFPVNLKSAYTFAAAPARVALENNDWDRAANLPLHAVGVPWARFPWQEAINHFARLLGNVHLGKMEAAEAELKRLGQLHDTLISQNEMYRAGQVAIQMKAGKAWIKFRIGEIPEALSLMKLAADMEDSTSKHPVTPGEVLPARELYANMLLENRAYKSALQAYEAVLQKCPNRFNSLYGAGLSAEMGGDRVKSGLYFAQLCRMADIHSRRPELTTAREFAADHS
jgi:tetratricopeptide (TPR) repeat protein